MNSWRIMTIRGVPMRLHWTFIVFFPVLVWSRSSMESSWLWGAAVYALVFMFVALHELAHTVVAQRYGVRVRSITLYPIGGIAALERVPEQPRQEAAIAAAGPAFNLAVAAALFAFIVWLPGIEFDPFDLSRNPTPFTQGTVILFQVNLVMALFNLLPAFPMDGGRILRAALVAAGRDYARATILAVTVGRVLLFAFGALGLVKGNVMFVFIAVMLYAAGRAEESAVRIRHALRHLLAAHLLPMEAVAVEPETELGELVPWLLEGAPRHFPVLARGRVAGLVAHDDLIRGLGRPGGAALTAAAVMRPAVLADPAEPLADIGRRLEERGAAAACIVDRGKLAGLVSREMLAALARQLDPAAD